MWSMCGQIIHSNLVVENNEGVIEDGGEEEMSAVVDQVEDKVVALYCHQTVEYNIPTFRSTYCTVFNEIISPNTIDKR